MTRRDGPWARFHRAHLYDYNPQATRLWVGIVAAGALALAWAVAGTLAQPPLQLALTALAMAVVAFAAWFTVQVPRTSYAFSVADIAIFTTLATLGGPAAVLAAGVEGAVGAARGFTRLSGRLTTPAAAMSAMAATSLAYAGAQSVFTGWGLAPALAASAALCVVAPLQFVLAVMQMTLVVLRKRGLPLRLGEWLASYSWVAAIYLVSAFVAAFVTLNMRQYGAAVLVVAAATIFGVVALLRATMARQDRERTRQEARIADAERDARLNQQRFSAAFTHAAVGMAIVDEDGRVLRVNRALCELFDDREEAFAGQPFAQWLHPGDAELFQQRARAAGDEPFSIELRGRRADGRDVWVALHRSRFDDEGAAGSGLIFQLHDITSRRQAEHRLQHIAYHDGLTDLANRHCFQERLAVAVERSRTDPAHPFAVLFLDLDRFKVVNDSLGHIAGNELLREVGVRLRDCVRPDDLVARLGGDEFALLLEGLDDTATGTQLAERVLLALQKPVSINGTEVVPGASIGITFSDMGYRTADEVLRDADLAMYEAKGAGRGRVAPFDVGMHERIADRLALESDLRRAIGAGQLSVVFQPLFDLDPYRPYGFEALARWEHPERGPVSPAVFITLAEEAGHIEALTAWVIDHACEQLAHWHRSAPHMAHLGMHVNVSGRDLARPGLVDHVKAVLDRHGLDARHLTLEITETTLMSQLEASLESLRKLRELGVHFSIDDFGTGYSSLAYLSTLPIDSLKIDRSFVLGMGDKPQNVEIVRAVMDLGRSLGKRVIAEGIETPEQLAALRRLGIPVGQGYLLSRPLRADQVPGLLYGPIAA